MRAACESILAPISETLIDLLSRVEPEYQEQVRNNIILAGGSSLISGLPDALEKACSELGGGRVTVVKDPIFAGSDGGLSLPAMHPRIGISFLSKPDRWPTLGRPLL